MTSEYTDIAIDETARINNVLENYIGKDFKKFIFKKDPNIPFDPRHKEYYSDSKSIEFSTKLGFPAIEMEVKGKSKVYIKQYMATMEENDLSYIKNIEGKSIDEYVHGIKWGIGYRIAVFFKEFTSQANLNLSTIAASAQLGLTEATVYIKICGPAHHRLPEGIDGAEFNVETLSRLAIWQSEFDAILAEAADINDEKILEKNNLKPAIVAVNFKEDVFSNTDSRFKSTLFAFWRLSYNDTFKLTQDYLKQYDFGPEVKEQLVKEFYTEINGQNFDINQKMSKDADKKFNYFKQVKDFKKK
jgi:hypothetical protein